MHCVSSSTYQGLQKLLIKLKFNDRFSFSSKFDYFGFRPFRLTFGHQSSICRPPFSTSFTSEGTPCRQYTCQMSIAPAIKGNLNTLRPRMICHFYFKKEVSFHTVPWGCQPDRLGTLSFMLDYFYCDRD